MMIKLHERYPDVTFTLERLSVRVRGVKSEKEDPVLARVLACEVSDECAWRHQHQSWFVPARPEVVERFVAETGALLPADVNERCEFLIKANEARIRANKWRALPIHDQDQWLKKVGMRHKVSPPLQHQVTSIGYGLQNPLWGAFLDTGLGKTYVAASIMQVLKEKNGKGPFLVVAPKSLLREAWGADIEKHTDMTWLDIGEPPAPDPITVCPACKRDFKNKPVPKVHLKTHIKKFLDIEEAGARSAFQATGNFEKDEEALKILITERQKPVWDKLYGKFPGMRAAGNIDNIERVEEALKRTDVDVYVMNPERAKMCLDVLKARKFDMIVVDESSMMRAHNSQTTEALIDLAWTSKRRIAMSGTPRPNSSLELWGQFAFLDGCFSHRFSVFRDKYFQPDASGFHWLPRPGMDSKFADMIDERVLRYKLEDCVDLQGETFETHEVELDEDIRKHYKTMLEEMLVELDDETIATPYKLVQINKLAQITSGFIYDKDGKEQYLSDGNPKLVETIRVARQLVKDQDRAVVIWVRFSHIEASTLAMALGDLGVSVMIGGMSGDQIEKSSKDFKSGKNKVMVAHALTAKFGHTWTHATASIFHSYDYSWENYYQARHRIYRIGQKQPVTHINIVARKSVDKIIMRALTRKEHESAVVIDRKLLADLRGTL